MDKPVPANIQAEEAIIGSIIFDPESIDRIKEWLPAKAFYVKRFQKIYTVSITLRAEGKHADFITLVDWFASRKLLDDIGGTVILSKLLSQTVSAVNLDRYAQLVLEKYHRRQIIWLGNSIEELGYSPHLELDEIYQQIREQLPDKILGTSNPRLQSSIKNIKYQVKHPKNNREQIEFDVDVQDLLQPTESMKEIADYAREVADHIWNGDTKENQTDGYPSD